MYGAHFLSFSTYFRQYTQHIDQSKKRKISISTKIEVVEFFHTPSSSIKKAIQKFQVSRGTIQRAKKQAIELILQKKQLQH